MTPELKEKADQVYELLKDCDKPDYHAVLKEVAGCRPWRPRRTGVDAVLDQLGHAVWAAALVLPLLLWPSYYSAALVGFVAGAAREIEQYFKVDMKILMIWDRLLDIVSFVVGALVVYHIVG